MTRFLWDERVLAVLIQIAIGAAILVALWQGWLSVLEDMRARGLAPGLGFLDQLAGFRIGEGPTMPPDASYGHAFAVGLVNTLRVSVLGIALATLLGVLLALARLSGNPLAEMVSGGVIDLFRNTPLVVQLIFWYQGVILTQPALGESLALLPTGAAEGAEAAAVFLSRKGLALATAGTGGIELPVLGRFQYEGGVVISPEFLALLVGLVVYTGAFIAEVFRSGINAVGRGQTDAALGLGLGRLQTMRLVILPQALRVIVPPLTSQYLNLTKNSSLAIAVGYPDLFNVAQTISNQTGQAVMVIALIMSVYLAISLVTSLAMNLYNRRVALVER